MTRACRTKYAARDVPGLGRITGCRRGEFQLSTGRWVSAANVRAALRRADARACFEDFGRHAATPHYATGDTSFEFGTRDPIVARERLEELAVARESGMGPKRRGHVSAQRQAVLDYEAFVREHGGDLGHISWAEYKRRVGEGRGRTVARKGKGGMRRHLSAAAHQLGMFDAPPLRGPARTLFDAPAPPRAASSPLRLEGPRASQGTLGMDLGRKSGKVPLVLQRSFAEQQEVATVAHVRALLLIEQTRSPEQLATEWRMAREMLAAETERIAAGRGETGPGSARDARIRVAVYQAAADRMGVSGRGYPQGVHRAR